MTLTLGIAYLTVLAHERNRQAQAQSLRSQSRVLNGLFEYTPLPPPQSRAELAREERGTLAETAKDLWNSEVENAVRWVQRTDWNGVREGMEGAISRLLGGGIEKSREGINEAEMIAGPKVQEVIYSSKTTARKVVDQAGSNTAAYGDAAKAKADEIVANAKSGAQDAAQRVRNSGGTVDAQDVVSKGVEKGKEAVDEAQAAGGFATETAESKAKAAELNQSSAVEKALHERYEKHDGMNKSVDEVLEERYKPINSRDNKVLRGV